MEHVKWMFIMWGLAAFLSGLGMYAARRKKPMWIYTGVSISPEQVEDVKAYNMANAKMWLMYSVPYWFSGFLLKGSLGAALALFVFSATVGIAWPVYVYHKIEEKYIKN